MTVSGYIVYSDLVLKAYQIIQLDGGNAMIDAGNDLLRDGSGINMVCVEAITQSRYTSCDLVKLDTLLTAV